MVEKANYTKEMTEKLLHLYEEWGNEALEEIAKELGKNVRSVRAKLAREGVYVANNKKATNVNDGASKKVILREIEARNFDVTGFEGATKPALNRLLGLLLD